MRTSKQLTGKNDLPHEPYRFTKRLGSTTFLVNVHSSKTNSETAHDKIVRLIRNDTSMGKAVNQ